MCHEFGTNFLVRNEEKRKKDTEIEREMNGKD